MKRPRDKQQPYGLDIPCEQLPSISTRHEVGFSGPVPLTFIGIYPADPHMPCCSGALAEHLAPVGSVDACPPNMTTKLTVPSMCVCVCVCVRACFKQFGIIVLAS